MILITIIIVEAWYSANKHSQLEKMIKYHYKGVLL